MHRVVEDPCLKPASELMAKAGSPGMLREKRVDHVPLKVDGKTVLLRDQRPLFQGNIEFQDGWAFEDLLQELNRRVYFWPGTEKGPSAYGLRHFERYSKTECAWLIRIPTADLFSINEAVVPEFCQYNSGAPRCSGGKKSPRGASTFLPADRFAGTPSDVVEVTFTSAVRLPYGSGFGGGPTEKCIPFWPKRSRLGGDAFSLGR